MPLKIAGKQIEDATITQGNVSILTITILSGNSATNKNFVDTTISTELNEMYYSQLNHNMSATGATVGQKACLTAVIEFPISNILVRVNGTLMDVGSGKDCYFSPDGVTIRTGGLGQKGDYLYWNSSKFNLDTNDNIDFIYFVGYDYIHSSGGTTTIDPKYNTIVVRFTGDTMDIILSGVTITLFNDGVNLIWDYTDVLGAGSYTFTTPNESIIVHVNGGSFVIWYDGLGSFIYSVAYSHTVSWIQQADPFPYYRLSSVYFTDSNNGWIVGTEPNPSYLALIQHTNDGGTTWTKQTLPSSLPNPLTTTKATPFSVYFTDVNNGWMVGYDIYGYNMILNTTDGGTTWVRNTSPVASGVLYSVYFSDSNNGWISGNDNSYNCLILKTNDGGTTWVRKTVPIGMGILYDVFFSDSGHGWAVGWDYMNHNIILHTTDGGNNWSTQTSPTNGYLQSVHFVDNNTGWICGYSTGAVTKCTILHTSNGGSTWSLQPIPNTTGSMSDIKFLNSMIGYALGQDQTDMYNPKAMMFTTTNGGSSWSRQQIAGLSDYLFCIDFSDLNTAWAVGTTILKG